MISFFPAQYAECLQTNNCNGLPFFQGYTGAAGTPDRRIHHQHQATIPSYKFNCCGNITEWGVDLNPVEEDARFTFDFQVWRPSPTVNEDGCYSLVNNFIIRSTSLPTNPAISHVARVTPLPQDQLQFQPGDVLGFYVESHGTRSDNDNGVVFLNNGGHTSELVWHAKIDETARTSQSRSGSCPYPVGTNRVLSTSRCVAPVISISITTAYFCSASNTHLPHATPTLTPTVLPTDIINVYFMHPRNETSDKAKYTNRILILGVSLPVVSLLGVVFIMVTVIIKRFKNPTKNIRGPNPPTIEGPNTEQVSDSELYVYDSPTINTIQLKQNVAYGTHSKVSLSS